MRPLPDEALLIGFDRCAFYEHHNRHWQIEHYHRVIKPVCNLERFQVRGGQAIKNHLFSALYGFVQLQKLRAVDVIENGYRPA